MLNFVNNDKENLVDDDSFSSIQEQSYSDYIYQQSNILSSFKFYEDRIADNFSVNMLKGYSGMIHSYKSNDINMVAKKIFSLPHITAFVLPQKQN